MPSDRDRVAQFIAEHCFAVPGAITRFTDFHEQFVKWVDGSWPKVRLSKALRELLPVGLMGANLLYVGNLSLEPASPGIPYRLVRDKLRQG
ncbi:MAG TPA: hypothetical protein VG826_05340 [Pirellulales bacterium]|nr:hypothetical protein [Pirellulales bacterium]